VPHDDLNALRAVFAALRSIVVGEERPSGLHSFEASEQAAILDVGDQASALIASV
jgi:hypothetical protein